MAGDFEGEDEITDYVKCKIESLRAESVHKEDEVEGMYYHLHVLINTFRPVRGK